MELATTSKAISADELIQRARALIPALAERAAAAEAARKVPAESVAEMEQAGLFRVLQPKRYGGYELPPRVFYEIQMALAQGCMSTAWIYGVIAVHNWQLALFDPQAQEDVWGADTNVRIASSYMPVGKVTPVEGGFRFSGRWGFSSGCEHCDWVFLGGLVPPAAPGEAPEYRTFLLPKSDYRIVHNWEVMGLKGTGSHDILVEDVFVPEHRTHKSSDGFTGQSPGLAVNSAPLYRLPFGQIFTRAVSTACIGALEGALASYKAYAANRVSANSGAKTVEDPSAQAAYARAASAVDHLKLTLFRNFDALMAYAERGENAPIEERARYRFQAAEVAEICAWHVSKLLQVSGGHGVYLSNPLVRFFLDIHTARCHFANNADLMGRNFGGVSFGLDNKDNFI